MSEDIYREPTEPYPTRWAFKGRRMKRTTTERSYNVFFYVDPDGFARQMGIVAHELVGSDPARMGFLKRVVDEDYKQATRFDVSDHCFVDLTNGQRVRGVIRQTLFNSMMAAGKHYAVLEPMFLAFSVKERDPLCVITWIVDGNPRIEGHITYGHSHDKPEDN